MENKKWFFAGILLAVSFFVAENVKAEDCYAVCANDSNPDACFADCQGTYGVGDVTSGNLGADEEWDCSAYPGTKPDANGNCVTQLESMSAGTCSRDLDCGTGFECYQGTCVDNATYQGETSWYGRAWESTKETFTGDWGNASSYGKGQGGVLNQELSIGGKLLPAGTRISADGTATTPDGTVYSNLVDNGTRGSLFGFNDSGDNSGGYGSGDGGFSFGGDYGPSYGGGNGSFVGPPMPGAKCAVGFVEVGGVCFPDKSITGLSDMPVTNIIANLFVWLMGIFVTLAIIAFVFSGVMYVTAYGDSKTMETAKNNAKWAVYGIITGLSGFIIVNAIAKALAGGSIF